MPYVGRGTDKISNVEVLDNITFDGSSSYTLQKGGSNFTPSSANTLLLSIDGVVQAGNFTVSGSTIDFGTAVAGTSTCDFVLHYGVGLITAPSDGTVTEAKIGSGAVTSAKLSYPLTTFSSTGIDDNATSTAITIDSSEFVGVGETVPLGKLHVKSADSGISSVSGGANELVLEGSADTGMCIVSGTSSSSQILFGDSGSSFRGSINYANNDDSLRLTTSASERMRIDSSGNILIGLTSLPTAGQGGVSFEQDGIIKSSRTSDSTLTHYSLLNPNGQVGAIKTSGSTTSYNTSSDYRLKENVSYEFDATTRLKQLKPARFNFIADADTTLDGFLAHEVQTVVPEAITGEKDAMKTEEYEITPAVLDDDGNVITEAVMGTREVPDYQGIDQAKLVPLLVKTIQELEARITALENA